MTEARRRVRTWIAAAGLAALCAGLALGWAIPRAIDAWLPEDPDGSNAATLKYMAENYGLTREQRRQIRMVLEARDREMLKEYRKHVENLPATLKTQIMDTRRLADERIYAVLSDSQREQYLNDLVDQSPEVEDTK